MAIESLAQQTSAFVDSLNIKPSSTEDAADKNAQEAKTPEQGDTMTISEEARALAAAEKPGASEQGGGEAKGESGQGGGEAKGESETDPQTQVLKNRIKQLEEEIKELEKSDLPDRQKLTQVQKKQAELMEYRQQLLEAEKAKNKTK